MLVAGCGVHEGAAHRLEAQAEAAAHDTAGAPGCEHTATESGFSILLCRAPRDVTPRDVTALRVCAHAPEVPVGEPTSPVQVRDKFHIICEGDNLPPPVLEFEDMRMPQSIIRYLETKNIRRPTPIQMQARAPQTIPAVLMTGNLQLASVAGPLTRHQERQSAYRLAVLCIAGAAGAVIRPRHDRRRVHGFRQDARLLVACRHARPPGEQRRGACPPTRVHS